MVDPTSDLDTNVTEETAPRCVICEKPIVNEPGHRVRTRIEDGTVRTRHFCSVGCLDEDRE
jgi:hypothetical protein